MKKAAKYVDGYLFAVPKKNLKKYAKIASMAAKVWIEHGALEYVECMGEDIPKGKVTSFPMAVKLQKGEVVCFAWATYKSKASRDRVLKKVMNDPRMQPEATGEIPFDGMRMMWGGFTPFVSKES